VVLKNPLTFATHFYRGEFWGLLFCHLVDWVDKGWQEWTTVDWRTRGKRTRKWHHL